MATRKHPQCLIDWSGADVAGSTLTVPLDGEAAGKWSKALVDVIGRLDREGTPWGAIAVKRGKVVVEDVQSGAEGDLRHLLEAAVAQVNADFAPPPSDETDGRSQADEAMTATFRAFAPDENDYA